MGPGSIVKLIEHDKELMEHFSLNEIIFYIGHSLLVGLILTYVTYYVSRKLAGIDIKTKKRNKLVLGSSNILFICVGITALMLLVNNNLARAFAIGAALGMIKFRVRLGPKSLSSNLLFAIIAGIACGVQFVNVAWIVTVIYIIIQVAMLAMMSKNVEGSMGLEEDEL